jgi:hypothetical protein
MYLLSSFPHLNVCPSARELPAYVSNVVEKCSGQCKSWRLSNEHCLTVAFRKPRNARSKRALDAREPKEAEDPRTAIFVRGTHPGEKVNNVMKDLVNISLVSRQRLILT